MATGEHVLPTEPAVQEGHGDVAGQHRQERGYPGVHVHKGKGVADPAPESGTGRRRCTRCRNAGNQRRRVKSAASASKVEAVVAAQYCG